MTAFIDRFESAFERLNQAIAAVVAVSIGVFAVLVPLDLFLRKFGWGNLPWLNEGAEYALYIGVFLSAAWVLNQGAHVRVDIVISALPARLSRQLERAIDLAGALLCAALCYFGINGAIGEFIANTLPDKDLRIPNWYMLAIFAIAFVLLTIEFLLRYRRVGKEDAAGASEAGF
jgi:TRAP-type C4-dicarboxylate transport system permease small subunit